MLKVIKGDLLDAQEKYIVHQANCCSTDAAGLAYDIFKRYPYSDIYSCREMKGIYSVTLQDDPGTIIIRGNGKDRRYVVALMGQYYPGGPVCGRSKDLDGAIVRQRYFHQALWQLAQVEDLESVAFPYNIGCGMAGGDWNVYNKIINNFARYLYGKADVAIYHKE